MSTVSPLDAALPVPAPDAWPGPAAPALGGWAWGFAGAIFLGAFLLFLVQPLIGKFILPWFGGGPAVWTTCLLFFQVLLLGGYLYAHLSTRFLSARIQAILHLTMLLAAIALLPVVPGDSWKPQDPDQPTMNILLMLLACVGLPYFTLSATGPLMQAWFSRVYPAASPYRLFALSNVGSLLALLGYPFLFEPMTTRAQQATLWSLGLVVFAFCCGACALRLWRIRGSDVAAFEEISLAPAEPFSPFTAALWLLFPAIASVLLMATTNTLCQDVAVVPFLWVLPLTVYLLSFIIPFDRPQWYQRILFVPLLLAMLMITMSRDEPEGGREMVKQIAIYAGLLFACCMICHGETARRRPHPRHLTAFYLMIAAGGAVGGLLVAVVAPLLLRSYLELQIGLVACALLLFIVLFREAAAGQRSLAHLGALFLSVFCLVWSGYVLYVRIELLRSDPTVLERSRNFYGVLSVGEFGTPGTARHQIALHHGRILHGAQYVDPQRRTTITNYYGPGTGAALALQHHPSGQGRRVAVVGLGAGTLAAFGRSGDQFRFYEINPEIERLARTHFTYLSDSDADIDIVFGDARLSMEREPPQNYDLIFLDAFSGDAVPVHLLTREAFDVYMRHLNPRGILAVHVSNTYLDLSPVVQLQAEALGLHSLLITTEDDPKTDLATTWWMLLTRDAELLGSAPFQSASTLPIQPRPGLRRWTDDDANLFQVLAD